MFMTRNMTGNSTRAILSMMCVFGKWVGRRFHDCTLYEFRPFFPGDGRLAPGRPPADLLAAGWQLESMASYESDTLEMPPE